MESNSKKNGVKKFTHLLTKSSQKLISTFFDESVDLKKEQEAIDQKVQIAIAQKTLAVIQLHPSKPNAPLETLSGWLFTNKSADSVIIKTQKDNQMRIINLDQIKKISILNPRASNRAIAD